MLSFKMCHKIGCGPVVACLILASLVCLGPVRAADAADPDANLDKAAEEILQRMSDYLGSSESLSFTVSTLFDTVQEGGIKLKIGAERKVFLRRPNKLYMSALRDDLVRRETWYDGKTLSVYSKDRNTYLTVPVPSQLDAMFDHVQDKLKMNMPLVDLLSGDLFKKSKESLISGRYLGKRLVDGVLTHYLSFESDGADWQVWVEAGDRPVPRRYVIIDVSSPGEPAYLARMSDWQVNIELGDPMFVFTPPQGARRHEVSE